MKFLYFQERKPIEAMSDLTKTRLSPRQLEVLALRANGYLNKEIAYELGICEETVKEHVSIALQKLQLKTVAHAVAYLVRNNVIR